MRETRMSGSEGGGELITLSLPLSSLINQQYRRVGHESLRQAQGRLARDKYWDLVNDGKDCLFMF